MFKKIKRQCFSVQLLFLFVCILLLRVTSPPSPAVAPLLLKQQGVNDTPCMIPPLCNNGSGVR